jgi:hypothetical protein
MFGAMLQMNNLGQPQGTYWQVGSTWTNSTNGDNAIAVDSSGNSYIVGISGASSEQGYVLKYNNSGTAQWVYTLSGSGVTVTWRDVTADSSGNTYTIGSYQPSSGGWAMSKYNTSGTIQWQKLWDFDITQDGFGATMSPNGNIIFTGRNATDIVTMAVDSSGAAQWTRRITSATGNQLGHAVGTDSSNNVYVVATDSNITSGAISLIKFNSSGTIQWQKRLDATGAQGSSGIAVSSGGNSYIVGSAATSPQTIPVIAKYDNGGSIQWQRTLTPPSNNLTLLDVAIDSSENVYGLGYYFTGSDQSIYIVKYNSSGTIQWQRTLDSSNGDTFYEIAINPANGNMMITGAIGGYAGPVTLQLPADGSLTGTWTWNSISFTYASASYTDAAGTLTDSTTSYTTSSITASLSDLGLTSTSRTPTNVLKTLP